MTWNKNRRFFLCSTASSEAQ